MLDLCTVLASICCVILWYCTSMIHRRLREANEPTPSGLIFNEPQLLRRYLEIATDNKWSRVPVIVAYFVFVFGLTSCVGFAVLLLAHSRK
jgi:hypothetical protein